MSGYAARAGARARARACGLIERAVPAAFVRDGRRRCARVRLADGREFPCDLALRRDRAGLASAALARRVPRRRSSTRKGRVVGRPGHRRRTGEPEGLGRRRRAPAASRSSTPCRTASARRARSRSALGLPERSDAPDARRSPLTPRTRRPPMADLSIDFAGIKSPEPVLARVARRPTNTGEQVMRAFDAGWGGAVWKTLGDPIVDTSSRFGALARRQRAHDGLQQHRADHRPAARGEPARDPRGQASATRSTPSSSRSWSRRRTTGARSSSASRTPAPTASS